MRYLYFLPLLLTACGPPLDIKTAPVVIKPAYAFVQTPEGDRYAVASTPWDVRVKAVALGYVHRGKDWKQ